MTLTLWLIVAVVVCGVIAALTVAGRLAGEEPGQDADRAADTPPHDPQVATAPHHSSISALFKRECPFCGGQLQFLSGYENSGADYAGATREVDDFRCRGCGREFRHIVKDNFTTFYEWWGLKTGSDVWSDLFIVNER